MFDKIIALLCFLLGLYTAITGGSAVECLLYYILGSIYLILNKLGNKV